ncbi:MAG: YebC/PmpR family DNA-binding transcriptional regulator [Bacteroidota bacterium]
MEPSVSTRILAAMSKAFTRIGKDIVIAMKEGGPDPDANARLRAVIQNAKSVNMPKDNIERAIKRATDKNQGNYKEVLFVGYVPQGIAILSSGFERIPQVTKELSEEAAADVEKLLEKIEENHDVQNVYHTMQE